MLKDLRKRILNAHGVCHAHNILYNYVSELTNSDLVLISEEIKILNQLFGNHKFHNLDEYLFNILNKRNINIETE